jgi:hypothetical protein
MKNLNQQTLLLYDFRLSKTNKKRMEIGSGSLEMNLDEKMEERIDFWTKIWKVIPTVKQTKTSKSWKNPKSFLEVPESPKQEDINAEL